ncbi:MAG: benzoate transporter [Glaciihabitans sp.]|nr:benzoate transporter [Glaciihabitans sp.]
MVLALRYRMPLSFAWSTPGAALLVATQASTGSFSAAVGAFAVCGGLILITGFWPWLTRAITRIPRPIASAMLAGVLFPICLAPIQASVQLPMFAIPIVAVWLVLYRLAPRWAVPGALVVTVVAIALNAGTAWLGHAHLAPALQFVVPTFEPLVIVSLGIPLYIVTMAGQNVPGFAVLQTFGYEKPPAAAILVGSGFLSAGGALFGGHAINLAALSAAIMAGPDAHPDPARRWIASFTAGATYVFLGLGAGVATALVSASPPILITAVAGLAMIGAFIGGMSGAFEEPRNRLVAAVTFLVVASGVSIVGIGSPFWGHLDGGAVMLWLGWARRKRTGVAEVG